MVVFHVSTFILQLHPAAVSFVKGEDNTVSASGTFIINDGFDTSSPESLQEFFGETGAVVENVPIT